MHVGKHQAAAEGAHRRHAAGGSAAGAASSALATLKTLTSCLKSVSNKGTAGGAAGERRRERFSGGGGVAWGAADALQCWCRILQLSADPQEARGARLVELVCDGDIWAHRNTRQRPQTHSIGPIDPHELLQARQEAHARRAHPPLAALPGAPRGCRQSAAMSGGWVWVGAWLQGLVCSHGVGGDHNKC